MTQEQPEATNSSEQTKSFPDATFDTLPVRMQQACNNAGWVQLMPVQAKTIPYVLNGKDLMVQSRTGSGKTGAYVLPLLEHLDPSQKGCQALVLVPTRELARQVTTQVELLGKDIGVESAAVYGGVGYGPQRDAFKRGVPIIVGTPGRILDHLLKRSLTLDQLKVLVFDEADRMLSMGFFPDMKEIQKFMPRKRFSVYMFSATFPPRVKSLARLFMHDPDFLSLSSDNILVAETEHHVYTVPGFEKDRILVRIIEMDNPEGALIFCNTRDKVHYVATVLKRFGYDADELSSDLSQHQRELVMNRIQTGHLRFLVATDVAERGIDIPDLPYVIQYEPPDDAEVYVHRAGRTGRAGAAGTVVTLVADLEKLTMGKIARKFGIPIQDKLPPSEEDVARVVAQRLTGRLEAKARERDNLKVERMQRFIPLANELMESNEGQELVAMVLDDIYQRWLHIPLEAEQTPPESEPQQQQKRSSIKRPPRKRSSSTRRRR